MTSPPSDDATITDPTKVDHPFIELVHNKLARAWEVNQYNPMPFIFDAVNPARIFHSETEESKDAAFVSYTQAKINKSTVFDPEHKLTQFVPKPYR